MLRKGILGVDFDNTIILYDRVLRDQALAESLIAADTPVDKTAVRDSIRARHNNEVWIQLQAKVYGQQLFQAALAPGFTDFLHWARQSGHTVYVISHKTRYPNRGPQVDLRLRSLQWMEARGLFGSYSPLHPTRHVFFEDTREAKLCRIARTNCQWFVDDLPELLGAQDFPPAVKRLWFHQQASCSEWYRGCRSWAAVLATLKSHYHG